MDGVLNFVMSLVSNPVVGLILIGIVIGLVLSRR